MRALRAGVASLLGTAALACSGSAAADMPRVALQMSFRPDRPNRSTTIHWSFAVSRPESLRTLLLRLPPGMGFANSSLGIEECAPAVLEAAGPEGCPADSRLGHGSAVAQVPAQSLVSERAQVTALLGPSAGGDGETMNVLFFVEGRSPVNREIVLDGQLSGIGAAGGATLMTEAPPLPVWPAGPDIGLVRFRSTIGPEGLTYYRRVGGRRVAFEPRGLSVPRRCPRGGFPVSLTLGWWAVSGTVTARGRVACPRG